MPFDEKNDDEQSVQSKKVGIKKVSAQPSIFDSISKKPSQEEFDQTVKKDQEKMSSYKTKTGELAIKFNKLMVDKTLPSNKNMFQKELEMELLKEMVKLAQLINSDIKEREGEGTLSWVTLLLRTALSQRDKINSLEYSISQLEKKNT